MPLDHFIKLDLIDCSWAEKLVQMKFICNQKTRDLMFFGFLPLLAFLPVSFVTFFMLEFYLFNVSHNFQQKVWNQSGTEILGEYK